MSTKTSIKRIALVAVAALGFGMVSTVSASAAGTGTVASIAVNKYSVSTGYVSRAAAANDITSLTTSPTVVIAAGAISTFDSTADIGKGLYSAANGYIGTITAITNSTVAAAGSITLGANAAVAVTNATDAFVGTVASTKTAYTVINANGINAITLTSTKSAALLVNLTNAEGAVGTGKVRLSLPGTGVIATSAAIASTGTVGVIPFTVPTLTPGTYNFKVSYSVAGTFLGTNADQIDIDLAITISAASQLSTALSTAYMAAAGTAAAAYTATTNAQARTGYKTAGTDLASIEVTLKNADGTAHALQPTITASIAGSGYVLVDTTATTTAVGTARASTGAASAAGLAYVHVDADGTAGTGTVTVSVTDAITAVTTVLGTFTVTSYGPATKLEVSTTNYTIGRFGGYTTGATGAYLAARTATGEALSPLSHGGTAATETTTPAFIIKVTDASGNKVNLTDAAGNAVVPTIVSSDISVVSGGTCALDDGLSTTYSSGAGVGYYNCNFVSAPTSVSGGKATLTVRTPDPADRSVYLTTTIAVTLGGKASTGTEKIALNAASYEPGEGITVTQTAVDASGNPVADGIASPAVTFNKAIGGTAPAASWYVGGKVVSDDATTGAKTVFAPVTDGSFTASQTNASLVVASATATVAAANGTGAAIDAANEATDAANAATDAANAAAEAADAATAAAQDAQAAVAALATSVSTLIAGIKAQITTLTNLVIKIQKKVRA